MNCFFPFNKKSESRKGKSSQEKEQVKGKKSESRKGKSSQEVLIEEEHVKGKKSESRKGKSSQKVLIEKEQVKGKKSESRKGKSSQEVLIEDEHVKGNKSESGKGESSQKVLTLIEEEHVKGKTSESRKGESSHEVLIEKELNLREFSFSELQTATENFNSSLIIGEDSYGRVFKGTITHPKGNGNLTLVAVQMLTGELGSMYWRAAFQFRGVVDHPNIVKLLGYCSEDGKRERHRLLVHEYMPNGSLRDHLSDKASTTLPWMTRLEIILGAAQTLAYLHEGLEIQVIYRDFKPSNVLLDEYFKPKLSELGFATESPTNKVVGTFGYMAPEYFLTGHITVKSDVYSFGVALYEILTGRQVHDIMPMEDQTLQEWVKLHLADGIDPRLENQYSLSAARQIAKLADTCLNKDPKNRPRMSQVVENLKQVMEESVEESFSEKGRSKSSASSKHSDQMEVIDSSRRMEGFRIPDKQYLSAPDIVLNISRYGTYRPVRLGIWRLRYRYVPYRISRYTKKVKKFTTATPDSRDVSPIRPDTDTPIPLFKTMAPDPKSIGEEDSECLQLQVNQYSEPTIDISDCWSTSGAAPEGGVSFMEETVRFNEMGAVATKGQKLYPEDKEPLSEVTESFYEELWEELFLEKLKETPSEPRELEELNCDPVEVPPTIPYHFSALHVLDLSYTEIKSLPQSISRLIALQKLFLRSCELLMELPPEIGELTNLEVLDLEGTEILCLPKEIAKLVNLKSLKVSFYGYANQTVIPRRVLLNLSRLNELIIDMTPYGEWWDAEVEDITDDLFSLDELRTLKLYLPNSELLEGLTRIFSGLVNFRFTVGRHEEHFISRFPQNVEEEFNNWEKLEKGLKFINGNHIPNEITKVLKEANAFVLKRHWTAESLSEFGHENMNEVKFCLVMECNELQTIVDCEQFYQGKDGRGESEDFKDFDKAIVLGSLEKLIIRYMKNMVSIWKGLVGKGSLLNLKSLALHTCPSLTALFTIDMLRNLINLEELIVEDCPKIESLISLKSTGSNLGLFLRNLKKISLLELPELVSISSGLLIAPNLERMVIFYCPKLEKLSTTEVSSTELKVIKGEKEWWDALKWYESDLSTEHEDYLARLFIPLRRDGDLMAQLTED